MISSPPLSRVQFVEARKRLLRMHYESKVGHIGGNLSALDAMLVVFHEFLGTADCFILSKGHAAGALYVTLWSQGRLSDDDLKTFHRNDTLLAGHPPNSGLPSVRFATGSLGHGLSLAAGTALAYKLKRSAARVFCMTSDGEWQEGSTWEALIFSCHHRLNNLTILVDHNELQGFGTTTDVASMAPLWKRLGGFDISISVIDGHDSETLRRELNTESLRPRLIVLQTIKGHGVSFMQGKMEWHYLPMSEAEYQTAVSEIEGSAK